MCIIIDNSAGTRLPDYIIENSLDINPHGFGFIDLETGSVFKTEDRSKMEKLLKSESPFIAHCRYATVGGVNRAGIHPHRLEQQDSLQSFLNDGWLMQNGTVSGFAGSSSDSHQIASLLQFVDRENMAEFLEAFDSRFLIYFDDGEVIRTGKWIEKDGVYYSKDNVLVDWRSDPSMWEWDDSAIAGEDSEATCPIDTDRELVAVYGTLKQGYGNNYLLDDSALVADVTTVDPYRLCISSLPFLISGPSLTGVNVGMELYSVDRETLASLDLLEGHPNWYTRETIEVTDGTSTWYAYVYTVGESYDDGVYYESYNN